MATYKPVFVLVRPQLGENIGKAARAMLNFGLTDLRLVTPRDGWPNPTAGPAASGADIVLEGAQVFGSLADAVADCAHVYATTVRKRGVTKPVVTPEQAALEVHQAEGRSAYVFGPERAGLETEDVALARAILTVPINPEFASLNLAQAVILCAYEWSKHLTLAADGRGAASPSATGRAGRADRPFRADAGRQELLLAPGASRNQPTHLAQSADQAGVEPPGGANLARYPHHARSRTPRALATLARFLAALIPMPEFVGDRRFNQFFPDPLDRVGW